MSGHTAFQVLGDGLGLTQEQVEGNQVCEESNCFLTLKSYPHFTPVHELKHN